MARDDLRAACTTLSSTGDSTRERRPPGAKGAYKGSVRLLEASSCLPKALPMARPGNPVAASSMLTARSGSRVPRPAIAIPTGRGETRSRCASLIAPCTTRSPPASRSTTPGTVRTTLMLPGPRDLFLPGARLARRGIPREEPQNGPCIRPAEVPSRTAPVIRMGSPNRATGTRRPIAHDAVFAAALCAKRH